MEFVITNKGKRLGIEHIEEAYPKNIDGRWVVEVKLLPIPFTITESMDFYRELANVFATKREAEALVKEINDARKEG